MKYDCHLFMLVNQKRVKTMEVIHNRAIELCIKDNSTYIEENGPKLKIRYYGTLKYLYRINIK